MEVPEVGAPGWKKVTRPLLRKAKQVFILCPLLALHVTHDKSMFEEVCVPSGGHAEGGDLHSCSPLMLTSHLCVAVLLR